MKLRTHRCCRRCLGAEVISLLASLRLPGLLLSGQQQNEGSFSASFPCTSLPTSPSVCALCSRSPADEEQEKHMGAGAVEPGLGARTGFFAREN